MKDSIISNVAGLALLAILSASGPALADSANKERSLEPSVTVRYGDLNLSSKDGARTLYNRIRTAAQTVCGPSFSVWDSSRWQAWKVCYNETIDVMVKRVNRPMLTAVHEQSISVASR